MIEIDGSIGEGGGQILRTSLSLACLTGRPIRIYNIRAERKTPGLKPQHLMSVTAAARVTHGEVRGATLGSGEVIFRPGPLSGGSFTFDVAAIKASAGSTGLIFQTIVLPLGFAHKGSCLTIKGGTHVEWSPSADYLREIFLPVLSRTGLKITLENPVKGYYPMGGGEIDARISPLSRPLKPLRIIERGNLKRVSVLSTVANLPISIAERQIKRTLERLKGLAAEIECRTIEAKSPGRGTSLLILSEFENIRAGFTALGARGKRAEEVADEAVGDLLRYLNGKGAADPHLADQIILPIALGYGESAISTTEISGHLRTNMEVIKKFLDVKFSLQEDRQRGWLIKVEGVSFKGNLFKGGG